MGIPELEALYAQLPKIECQRKCGYACINPDMSPVERERIREASGHTIVPIKDRKAPKQSCLALGILGSCTVYQLRPAVCRLWGLTRSMHCRYGCTPVGGFMSEIDSQVWLAKVLMAGGAMTKAEGEKWIRMLGTPAGGKAIEWHLRKIRFMELLAWRRHHGITDNNLGEMVRLLTKEAAALEARHETAGES